MTEQDNDLVDVDGDELADLGDARAFDWSLVDRSVLLHPILVRAAVGVAVVLVFLLWPDRGRAGLTRLVGAVLLVVGATGVWSGLRTKPRQLVALAASATLAVVGTLLQVAARQRPEVLGRALGIIVALAGARELVAARRNGAISTGVLRSLALIGAGAALLIFPEGALGITAIAFGTGWILVGAAAVSVTLNPHTPSAAAYDTSQELLDAWFSDRPKRADSRRALYDKILFEGTDTSRRIVRFIALMSFASIIASMGVITDSTAVVIGAMLIAPLMTPLMGMAISLVMGWPKRLGRSALVAATGILIAIVVGLLLGLIVPAVIDTSTNSQIVARTNPTTLDMIVALAAGAAGAYALSRPDVSDSLPGVAIAISLVPPLTVVGISYSQGDWDAGNGALLLYSTNMLAILIMGGLTFIVTGVTPLAKVAENQLRLKTWGLALAAAAAVIVGALFLNGAQLARDAFDQDQLQTIIGDWIEPYEQHSIVQSRLDDDFISAVIVGPSDQAPDAQSLADQATNEFGRSITAEVRLLVEERDTATSEPSD